MNAIFHAPLAIVAIVGVSAVAAAQDPFVGPGPMLGPLRPPAVVIQPIPYQPPRTATALHPDGHRTPSTNRSGPRFGALWLSDGLVQEAKDKNVDVRNVVSLFGWQSEFSLANNPNGPQPLSELVLLVAGLDQGAFIPSASWILGVRTQGDWEMGVGPNASAAGVALVVTAGMTQHFGTLNVPVNVAYVPSKNGSRFSVTTGFNVRD
jgi:hypothetical protein